MTLNGWLRWMGGVARGFEAVRAGVWRPEGGGDQGSRGSGGRGRGGGEATRGGGSAQG